MVGDWKGLRMPKNNGSFKLAVETQTYRNGIITREASLVNDKTRYGLERLSEALYVSATACADRHAELALLNKKGGN